MLKNILVTGGAGFIGSHLVETLLSQGYCVRVLDNLSSGTRDWVPSAVDFVEGDVANRADCDRAVQGMDAICHLAAMSRVTTDMDKVDLCTRSNVLGTQNILMAAKAAGIKKLVYSGSSTAYGSQATPHREHETPIELLNFYAVTKYTGEQYCQLFDRLYDLPVTVLRYFNVYGPRQPEVGMYALVIGIFLKRLREGKVLELHGSGAQRRDFVHVRDVARAIIAAMESPQRGMTYNVGTGVSYSIKEIADLISPNQTIAPARAGDAKETLADIARISRDLGWQPEISLAEGIDELKTI